MSTQHRFFRAGSLTAALLLLACGCAHVRPPQPAAQRDVGTTVLAFDSSRLPATTVVVPDRPPVVSIWRAPDEDDEAPDPEPSVLFAGWADGTVVRSIGPKLYIGHVESGQVAELMRIMQEVGFGNAGPKSPRPSPESPSGIIATANRSAAERLMRRPGARFASFMNDSAPAPDEFEAYVWKWAIVLAAIEKIYPDHLDLFEGKVERPDHAPSAPQAPTPRPAE